MNMKYIIFGAIVVLALVAAYAFFGKEALAPTKNEGEGTPTSGVVSYANSSADLIVVESPKPNETVGKTFSVSGQARGTWYFEASFPIEVRDAKGDVVLQTHADAEGEWMTEEFVPFKARVELPASFEGKATLVLKKDNPSGEPERDAWAWLPIVVR